MQAPTIKQYTLPKFVRVTAMVFTMLAVFLTGYIGGIATTMYDATGLPPIQIILELPAPTPYVDRPTTRSAAVEQLRWKYDNINDELKCLADNIYFEGRGENIEGQLAIGLTTINRVKNKYYPDSICDVVWQKGIDKRTQNYVAQFSWTLDGKPDKITDHEAYEKIELIAHAMIAEGTLDNITDFTDGATHYHADYVDPYWSDSLNMVAQIDSHIFYNNKGNTHDGRTTINAKRN